MRKSIHGLSGIKYAILTCAREVWSLLKNPRDQCWQIGLLKSFYIHVVCLCFANPMG